MTGWRRLALIWLPPALYLALIFAFSGLSQPPVPVLVDQNLLHYPEYALLGFLLARALQRDRPGFPGWWVFAGSAALASLWGVTDEIHQAFVPGRVPDALDWWHDTVGGAVGAAAWALYKTWKR